MKAIEIAKSKYNSLVKEDFIELTCPDQIMGDVISKPDWCKDIGEKTRLPEEGHNCRECWQREVK